MNANYKMTYKMKVADQPKYLRPWPKSKRPTRLECPLCANSGHYWTSLARISLLGRFTFSPWGFIVFIDRFSPPGV